MLHLAGKGDVNSLGANYGMGNLAVTWRTREIPTVAGQLPPGNWFLFRGLRPQSRSRHVLDITVLSIGVHVKIRCCGQLIQLDGICGAVFKLWTTLGRMD